MKYVQVCKALYDYEARTEDELSIKEDDILYVIEKEDQDWWRTELKQSTGEEQGPIGLVPADYLEEVTPIGKVRAEYDYEAQQEEELSFQEGQEMDLLEQDDPDWYLVKLENGEIGLAPSNYVVASEGSTTQQHYEEEQEVEQSPYPSSAVTTPPAPAITPPPAAITTSPPVILQPVPTQTTGSTREMINDDAQSWQVHEYDAAKKKKKKGKGNLFIGNGMLCYGSETDKASPVQQYPILDVRKYLFDGKNLHIEIEGQKSAVLDLQATSKSEAKAILVKISDSTRAAQQMNTTLNSQKQVAGPATPIAIVRQPVVSTPSPPTAVTTPPPLAIAAAPPVEEEETESNCVPKWGISLYSFEPEGGDELNVDENEQIYVLDYERTDGWWRVQKVDGSTGLVPSSYVQFDNDQEEDDNQPIASAAAAAANVENIRKKREQEERILQQKRIAEEEERNRIRREEEENRRRREEEEKRKAEEEAERDRRRQVQEVAKRAEQQRQKQIELDYKRKEEERKATLKKQQQHKNLPKPDPTKIRTWTDRSGSFKVEAQFIDFHNGKLRLHKLNGVKIDVPAEKICAEDVRWVEDYTKQHEEPKMPPRPQQQQPLQPSKPEKKLNERWDWFDWFMIIGIPMQQSLQYASSFKQEKLDDSDIHNLTHKQMKTLGLKEEHVRRIERYIETGEPEEDNEEASKVKQKSQMEKDEDLARKLQKEWETDKTTSISSNSNARPRPTVSAPKDIHPDLLDFIGTQLTSSSSSDKGKEPANTNKDLVGFNDDAWTPRAEINDPIKAMMSSPVKATPAPAGPTPDQIKQQEAERKRLAEEEQIQKIQLMNLQRQAKEQQQQLEQLQLLTKQQLELQKQLAMQTGTQQQQQQQQLQMQQVQQQQQLLQQQLAQQPPQLQPSLTMQPTGLGMQPTGMNMQPTNGLSNNITGMSNGLNNTQGAARPRPVANTRIGSDLSLGQWQANSQQNVFLQQQQQPTAFQAQQQQQQQQQGFPQGFSPQGAAWQAQQLQPQMTGFPAGNQPIGGGYQQQVPLSSILPQPLQPSSAGQQQQQVLPQATGNRHWGSASAANPFGSPTLSPLQAQMTGVQFSTPSPQAFHQSPIIQPQPTGASVFTPQGSMQYGQSAFPNQQRPW